MTSRIVRYQVDESTVVGFEVEHGSGSGFRDAGAREFIGHVREAAGPAMDAARVILEKAKETAPSGVEVKFGVKVNGEANWVVAKAATEGSFEVTLTWSPDSREDS